VTEEEAERRGEAADSAVAIARAGSEQGRAGSARSGPEEQPRQVRAIEAAPLRDVVCLSLRARADLRLHYFPDRGLRPVFR
jgi:hypothetical protein